MFLRPDWRRVLFRAWSVRIWALAILVIALDVALPWFRDALPISDRAFGAITLVLAVGGIIARLFTQRGFPAPPS